jgi:PIN domain nuclease of toxin-antitoxin system
MIVLDASALLAFMFREPGHDVVASVIDKSCISAVNVSEVIGRFTRDGHDHRMVFQHLERSPVEMVPFLPEDGALTAALVPATRHLGLALGDRACLALAMVRQVPAYTADRVWEKLNVKVEIEVIR